MHRLAKLSLANRSVVALATAIIAIFGFVSLGSLKQELIPSFETPQAAIVTTYVGASPEIIDKQVSQPIEDAVRKLDGLVSSTSTSQNNISIVRVEFDYGTKTATVTEDLNAALATLKGVLPAEADAKILSGSFDSVPIIALGVSSSDNEALGKILADVATPILSGVPGVRDVAVSGITEKRVNLELKQSVLTANGLTQQNIVTALQSNGFVIPAGTLTDGSGNISVEVGTSVESLKAFKELPLISSSSGSLSSLFGGGTTTTSIPGMPSIPSVPAAPKPTLTVSDVADVTYENAPVTSIARVNGNEVLTIAITKTQDGNTVAVSHGIQDKIAELKDKLGDVTITTIFDQAPFVEQSLENLTTEGLLGLTFAIIIILLFLLSFRSTAVTAISIPTSVLITFIGLYALDYSLNLFTLSALTIAIGRVVDDSIVVIENINRHLSYGEPKKKAVLNAVKEVSGAITAATITTVAVFLPIALVGGLVGELFRPFSFTFAIALLASLFVSLTIVPVLAYWFMKAPKALANETDPVKAAKIAEELREVEEAKERRSWLQRGYLPILKSTQKHPVITVVASFMVLIFTFGLVPLLKTDFIGGSGSSGFVINQELKPGATLKQESDAAGKLEDIVLKVDGVDVVQTTIGSSGDGRVAFGAAAGGITMQIIVKDGFDVAEVQNTVTKAAEGKTELGTLKFGSGGGGFSGSSTIDIKLTAKSDKALEAGIAEIEKSVKGIEGVSEITNSLASKERTLKVKVDRMAAARLGLTETAVGGIVASQMRPSSIGNLNVDGNSTPIYVVKTNIPDTVTEVRAIRIPTSTGTVSLDSIADIYLTKVPVSITSEKGDRTAKVSLTPDTDSLGALGAEVADRLDGARKNLPLGVTASVGGVTASQAESFGQLGLALLAAIAIVFIVMVATFSSIRQPLVLLISIPFAATGALGFLLLTDTPLGVSALIGMLLLVGIVVTNAIVLIDLINQYRKQGRPIQEAIMDGSRQRLRPILMTALATIFALTPMALGITGGGGFISQPLAIVVIGGLFSSTVLTLVIVPVLYWLTEGGKERKVLKAEKRAARKAAKA
ncbi:MAG: MMPL family transporter, partial [Actinobacteria bacterium]|nr:MMPL family transporter [Actinomycetota bacterium]